MNGTLNLLPLMNYHTLSTIVETASKCQDFYTRKEEKYTNSGTATNTVIPSITS